MYDVGKVNLSFSMVNYGYYGIEKRKNSLFSSLFLREKRVKKSDFGI